MGPKRDKSRRGKGKPSSSCNRPPDESPPSTSSPDPSDPFSPGVSAPTSSSRTPGIAPTFSVTSSNTSSPSGSRAWFPRNETSVPPPSLLISGGNSNFDSQPRPHTSGNHNNLEQQQEQFRDLIIITGDDENTPQPNVSNQSVVQWSPTDNRSGFEGNWHSYLPTMYGDNTAVPSTSREMNPESRRPFPIPTIRFICTRTTAEGNVEYIFWNADTDTVLQVKESPLNAEASDDPEDPDDLYWLCPEYLVEAVLEEEKRSGSTHLAPTQQSPAASTRTKRPYVRKTQEERETLKREKEERIRIRKEARELRIQKEEEKKRAQELRRQSLQGGRAIKRERSGLRSCAREEVNSRSTISVSTKGNSNSEQEKPTPNPNPQPEPSNNNPPEAGVGHAVINIGQESPLNQTPVPVQPILNYRNNTSNEIPPSSGQTNSPTQAPPSTSGSSDDQRLQPAIPQSQNYYLAPRTNPANSNNSFRRVELPFRPTALTYQGLRPPSHPNCNQRREPNTNLAHPTPRIPNCFDCIRFIQAHHPAWPHEVDQHRVLNPPPLNQVQMNFNMQDLCPLEIGNRYQIRSQAPNGNYFPANPNLNVRQPLHTREGMQTSNGGPGQSNPEPFNGFPRYPNPVESITGNSNNSLVRQVVYPRPLDPNVAREITRNNNEMNGAPRASYSGSSLLSTFCTPPGSQSSRFNYPALQNHSHSFPVGSAFRPPRQHLPPPQSIPVAAVFKRPNPNQQQSYLKRPRPSTAQCNCLECLRPGLSNPMPHPLQQNHERNQLVAQPQESSLASESHRLPPSQSVRPFQSQLQLIPVNQQRVLNTHTNQEMDEPILAQCMVDGCQICQRISIPPNVNLFQDTNMPNRSQSARPNQPSPQFPRPAADIYTPPLSRGPRPQLTPYQTDLHQNGAFSFPRFEFNPYRGINQQMMSARPRPPACNQNGHRTSVYMDRPFFQLAQNQNPTSTSNFQAPAPFALPEVSGSSEIFHTIPSRSQRNFEVQDDPRNGFQYPTPHIPAFPDPSVVPGTSVPGEVFHTAPSRPELQGNPGIQEDPRNCFQYPIGYTAASLVLSTPSRPIELIDLTGDSNNETEEASEPALPTPVRRYRPVSIFLAKVYNTCYRLQ